jgi:hypothetical protein
MRIQRAQVHRMLLAGVIASVAGTVWMQAQSNGNERTFPQSKATIEKTLKEMPTSGRLPVLDGFATSSDHPLERYQRGYYQTKFQVTATPSGGSVVRVSVQVTAWYADPVAAKSGYQLLPSNGRLEGDALDQLAEQLAATSPPTTVPTTRAPTTTATTRAPSKNPAGASEPTISAPVPRLPDVNSKSLAQGLSRQEQSNSQTSKQSSSKPGGANSLEGRGPLQTEIDSLQEVLKNQAHPKNLVAVRKSGTAVVSAPSLTARTLFLASLHDEFEMLDFNRDWVHVRISGLSRGWIWRSNLEMPESVPDSDVPPAASAAPTPSEIFHVTREETSSFPGDWEPLRGKSVKIVSVEKIDENAKDSSAQLRLEFAKFVMDKDYAELAQKSKSQELAGIVVIFDSADGGMIAATFPTLQRWKAGTLTDAALWHQCFFDPPETFSQPGVAASK